MKLNELTTDQWQQVRTLRTEWLTTGLTTARADRTAAAAALTEVYRLIGKPPPQFVWVDSPATAGLALWLIEKKPSADDTTDSLGASLGASLVKVLGSNGYILYKAIQDGKITVLPVPMGNPLSLPVATR